MFENMTEAQIEAALNAMWPGCEIIFSDEHESAEAGMRAAFAAIAEDWQLVPKELTPAIACALEDCLPPDQWPGGDPHGAIPKLVDDYRETWKRVLTASTAAVNGRERQKTQE